MAYTRVRARKSFVRMQSNKLLDKQPRCRWFHMAFMWRDCCKYYQNAGHICRCVLSMSVYACTCMCTCSIMKSWDGTWWRHQMETVSALLAICAGNSPVTGHRTKVSDAELWCQFSLISVWINGWVNIHGVGDLRRYRGHYDVNVIK